MSHMRTMVSLPCAGAYLRLPSVTKGFVNLGGRMIDIKPIETKYKGYLFRSRAEARWAMFFDLMKIPYAYEPEGLLLPNGIRYLPDFYLPDCDTWFEVKGVMDDTSIQKISALLKYGNKPVIVGYPDMTFEACDIWIDEGGMKYFARAYRCESMLCKCRKCGKYYFTGVAGSWECLCCGTWMHWNTFHQCSRPS